MENYQIQIIESIAVIIGYIITHSITSVFINNSLKQTHLQRGRRKMIIKAVHLLSFLTAIVILSAIWGLKQNEIGDTVKVLDKDCPFEGEVTDLTYFFIHLRTHEGAIITIPNALIFQKAITVIEKSNSTKL